jgi:hypothetical protein
MGEMTHIFFGGQLRIAVFNSLQEQDKRPDPRALFDPFLDDEKRPLRILIETFQENISTNPTLNSKKPF